MYGSQHGDEINSFSTRWGLEASTGNRWSRASQAEYLRNVEAEQITFESKSRLQVAPQVCANGSTYRSVQGSLIIEAIARLSHSDSSGHAFSSSRGTVESIDGKRAKLAQTRCVNRTAAAEGALWRRDRRVRLERCVVKDPGKSVLSKTYCTPPTK